MEEPVYWSPQMPLLADQRRDMPDVEKLQRTFVRYGASASPATVATAWQKSISMSASRSNRYPHDAAHAVDTPAAFSQLPDTISMEIARAPAEFAVPVKQDKRLKPPFKVRMSMTYKSSMSCPIALTAHAISHSEYERIDTWIPPEIDAQRSFEMIDRPNPTELKGNLTLEWRFDGGGGAQASGHANAPSYGDMSTPPLDLSGNGEAEADPLFDMFQSPNTSNNKQHEILLAPQHLPDMSLVKNGSDTDYQACLRELLNGGPNNTDMRQRTSLPATYGNRTSRGMPIGEGLMSNGDLQPDSQFVSHDFEFPDLEFARPSRMNKVYIVFACQIAKMDILYTAFAVPTICFCRREQKERAYQRLGIPYRTTAAAGGKRQHASAPPPSQPPSQRVNMQDLNDGGALDLNASNFGLNMPNDRAAAGGNEDYMQYPPFQNDLQGLVSGGLTAMEVKDYILDSYYSLGMVRKLTGQDITALLALSGFPQMGEPDVGDAVVTHEQFQDFKSGWECILTLLQKIHHCWNSDDPFIVCGFEIDHYHAVGALRNQPPGTFLCRFSLSQPGNMVLVCKVPSQSPNADPDGLVHGLLNVIDLQERRVDKWIIDFPGATHLLDVYSSRRVDKRKAFHTNYYRLENLHRSYNGYMPDQPDESST